MVSTERLIAELWDEEPPERRGQPGQRLRAAAAAADRRPRPARSWPPGRPATSSGWNPATWTRPPSRPLTRQGRAALAAGDAPGGAALLTEALALWRGDALSDIPQSGLVTAEADRLGESRLTALELRITAELDCGLPAELVPELRRLISDSPLREGLWLLLMQALDRAGRRAEAVAAFSEARRVIADELGVDPGPELRQLYQWLLTADAGGAPPGPPRGAAAIRATGTGAAAPAAARTGPAAMPAAAGPAAARPAATATDAPPASPAARSAAEHAVPPAPPVTAGAPGSTVPAGPVTRAARSMGLADDLDVAAGQAGRAAVGTDAGIPAGTPAPAQLPADLADFTGRAEHLARLRGLLTRAPGTARPAAVTVAVVAGTPGLGKTALAVHAAHELRAGFPDGQLYVSLLGASEQPVVPGEILARLLRDLGVKPDQIPAGQEERAALYRTRLADRRVLIVLDDARDAAQVRPLLPGSASCAVIVTSRHRLADLAGSRLVDLDVLDDERGTRPADRDHRRGAGRRRAGPGPRGAGRMRGPAAGHPDRRGTAGGPARLGRQARWPAGWPTSTAGWPS